LPHAPILTSQWAIKQFEPFGDKALELLQEQCAHISREDKSYFPEQLIGLKIRENESASSFIKCFTYAKTTSEAASNTYMNEQLVENRMSTAPPCRYTTWNASKEKASPCGK
jgi:hypothetical protein